MRKLLVSAYGCEPDKGSEQGVGWHWVLELSYNAELWVITRSNNREGIEQANHEGLADRIHFVYYDLPDVVRAFKRKGKGVYWYYALWQWGAYRVAKKLTRDTSFDYCIHLTFGSIWMPTFMYKLPIPFIWGPIGGGESVPWHYIRTLPIKGQLIEYARYLLIRFFTFNPLSRGATLSACAIIAKTEESKNAFPKKLHDKISVFLETGMTEKLLQGYQPVTTNQTFGAIEVLYVGRLMPIKNVALAIKALKLAQGKYANLRLTIVGEGPLRSSLKELTHKLGLTDVVHFVGAVSHKEAIDYMRQSHLFLFPSLKEGGTWSLMEAMAVGLPVICMDTTGMHVITDESCAIRIPPISPEDSVNRMAEALVKLADSAELRQSLGENGRKRIEQNFLWSKKREFIEQLIHSLSQNQKTVATEASWRRLG